MRELRSEIAAAEVRVLRIVKEGDRMRGAKTEDKLELGLAGKYHGQKQFGEVWACGKDGRGHLYPQKDLVNGRCRDNDGKEDRERDG